MADATFARTDFRGGQWDQWAQGRFHDQRYVTALNVCQNGLPNETGTWVRRPGFALAGTTRGGLPGRVIKFDFEEVTAPYTLEFTNNRLRFWAGTTLATTNDSTAVTAISAADPAEMTLAAAVTWATGDQGYFTLLADNPMLENRFLSITEVDAQHFTLADGVTNAPINGALLAAFTGGTFNHILEFQTLYTSGALADLRLVQSDADGTPVGFVLHPSFPPYALVVVTEPVGANFATFDFGAATFQDGPYLDPPTNGAILVPNQTTGVVTLTLQFPTWVSTTSYAADDFVTYSSANYQSLVDQNVGNEPDTSPSDWVAVDARAAINNGQGFLQTDIGRLVRLFSEPPYWTIGATYALGAVVSYNPNNLPGETTYWQSLVGSNTGNAPGADLTHWEILQQGGTSSPALWTWGQIVSLSNSIAPNPAGAVPFGDLNQGGGNAAAFNGNSSQNAAASARLSSTATDAYALAFTGYVGQNYTGASPANYRISSATIYPSSDEGLFALQLNNGISGAGTISLTLYLYGSESAPSGPANGTLLGQATLGASSNFAANSTTDWFTGPVNIPSNSAVAYAYVWVAFSVSVSIPPVGFHQANSITGYLNVAQVSLVLRGGSGASANGINVELLGSPLLYANPILTWQFGLYSNTTGWPDVGTWTDGRLVLSGVIPNRVDMCCSNGVTVDSAGTTVNFAPTDQYDNVLDSSGISIVMNLPEANPILWMQPDQQGIIAGTTTREALIYAPTAGGLTPTNIDARMITRIGSGDIEPQKCEHTFVFVQKYLRKVVEMFADVFSGKFTAPNLIADAKNLTVSGLQELAYQQELVPVVWARVNNGLIGCTYKRDTLMTSSGPTFNGWHVHTLGSGRQVVSICTGSSVNGNLDALTMVTFDPTTGLYAVEVLTDVVDIGASLSKACYVDSAVTPTSTSAVAVSNSFPYGGLQLNGLWNLNGRTVSAWLGGLDCGDYVVTNGYIQVPYGDGIGNGQGSFPSGAANRGDQGLFTAQFVSTGITANGETLFTGAMPMVIGFTFTSQGQLTRAMQPAESGARNGPAFGKYSRAHYLMMMVENAVVAWFGSALGDKTQPLEPANFTAADEMTKLTVDTPFTGVFRFQPESEYNFNTMPCWQVTRPHPFNISALGGAQETADV